jgi:hypothetical protein
LITTVIKGGNRALWPSKALLLIYKAPFLLLNGILYMVGSILIYLELGKNFVIDNVLDAAMEQASAISVLTSTVVCKP